jgi:hypothetical protein
MLFAIILPVLSIISILPANAQNITTISHIDSNNGNNSNDSRIAFFNLWNDPTENAFTVQIPKGWAVQPYLGYNSGIIRSLNGVNNADFIFNVTDSSAKSQIFFANSGVYYVEPIPALGINEGWTNHYYYRNAVNYIKEFILPFLKTIHPDAQIITIKNISSFPSPSSQQQDQLQNPVYMTTAASAVFSYTSNNNSTNNSTSSNVQGQYLAGVGVITEGVQGEGFSPGVWSAAVFGASAPKSEFHDITNLAQIVLLSPKINKEWAIAEVHGREARSNIITNEQQDIEKIINQHIPSGLDSKLSQAWSDTILGSSDWVSRNGEHYNLPNDFEHYWIDPSQNIAASNTDTSPGPEFTPLAPANVR